MRAILVDPISRTVTEVDHKNDYRDIYRLIEATTFTAISIEHQHTIYVDDEGLLADDPGPFFKWVTYHQPIAGKGLILYTNEEGDSEAAELTLEYVQGQVAWPNIEFVGFERIPDGAKTVHPILGEMVLIGSTPIFREKSSAKE